jgi:hypothetical protein
MPIAAVEESDHRHRRLLRSRRQRPHGRRAARSVMNSRPQQTRAEVERLLKAVGDLKLRGTLEA